MNITEPVPNDPGVGDRWSRGQATGPPCSLAACASLTRPSSAGQRFGVPEGESLSLMKLGACQTRPGAPQEGLGCREEDGWDPLSHGRERIDTITEHSAIRQRGHTV